MPPRWQEASEINIDPQLALPFTLAPDSRISPGSPFFQISITNELSSNYGGRGRGRPGESRRRKASRGWRGDTQLRRPRQLAGFAIGSRKTRSFHARTHGSGSFPSLCELERSCLRRRESSLELGSNRGAISVRVIAITRCKSPLKFFSYTFSASLITKKIPLNRSSGMIHILYVVILQEDTLFAKE